MRNKFTFVRLVLITIALLLFIAIASKKTANASPVSQSTSTPIGGGSGRIAFVANSTDLYTVNVDGSDLQKVIGFSIDDLTFAQDPIWTEDGKAIIYKAVHGNEIIGVDDRIPQPLISLGHSVPLDGRISKNGVLVYISSVFGAEELYSMTLDGTHVTRLTRGGFHKDPLWLPDGETLLFAFKTSSAYGEPYQICSINRRGRNFKCYTHTKRMNDTTDSDSHFSPKYSLGRIVFVLNKLNSREHQICTIPFEVGSTPRCLTHGSMDIDPAWSPDGTLIAFSSDRDGVDRLYIMDADGSNQHPVPFNDKGEFRSISAPAWQPLVK